MKDESGDDLVECELGFGNLSSWKAMRLLMALYRNTKRLSARLSLPLQFVHHFSDTGFRFVITSDKTGSLALNSLQGITHVCLTWYKDPIHSHSILNEGGQVICRLFP